MAIPLAKQLGIDRSGLIVEGKRFPFLIGADEIEVRISEDEIPSMRVTLLAERIDIDPSLTVETDGEVQFITEGGGNE